MEFEKKPGYGGRDVKRRKPVRKPNEHLIRTSKKSDEEQARDAETKYSGSLLSPGAGAHFERDFKRKDTGAPQPWDAAQRAAKKAATHQEQTDAFKEIVKKPRARSGCLTMVFMLVTVPFLLVIVGLCALS